MTLTKTGAMTPEGYVVGTEEEDPALRSELLDKLYGLAVDPTALPEFLGPWDQMLSPNWAHPTETPKKSGVGAGLIRHVRQAETLLVKTLGASVMRPEDLALLPYRRGVAFTLDRMLRVSSANRGARVRLGISRGSSLSSLRVRDEDISAISAAISDLYRRPDQPGPRLIRVRHSETDKPVLISLQRGDREPRSDFVLVATTELHLSSDRLDRLQELMGLSPTEIEVLTLLALDHSPAEIAQMRNRSLNTVRTQMKSLMTKTESNSQSDLVRLALMAMALPASDDETYRETCPMPVARAGLELPELPFRILRRAQDRKMDYLEFGDPSGRPVIYFCSNFGLSRWPADAELAARRNSLRVIVPIRPGYGWSEPLPPASNRVEEVARDIVALMDHLRIPSAHLLVLDEDMVFATALYTAAPARVRGVLGCGAALPFLRKDQYARMGRWHRFALGTARFTPHLMTFAATAGFAMARHVGKGPFVRVVYAGSPADVEATRKPRVFDAIDCGSDIVMADGVDAATAYAQDTLAFHDPSWADDFRQMSQRIRVIDLIGTEDQAVPAETLEEYRADFPDVQFETVENAGSFVLFQHTFLVLQWLENLMKNDVR